MAALALAHCAESSFWTAPKSARGCFFTHAARFFSRKKTHPERACRREGEKERAKKEAFRGG